MKHPSLSARIRPVGRSALTLSALFVAGISAATIVGTSAAAPADDCVLGLVCPGVTTPTLPTVTLSLPTTPTTTSSTPPATTPGTTPAAPPTAGGSESA